MHISDGVLPVSVSLAGYAATAVAAAWSAKGTKAEDLPKIAIVTSAFFVASLISVPIAVTSVHLLLPGLVGILLGRSAFLSIAVGVTLQSLMFQMGGITAIGANSIMMGIPALMCAGMFQALRGRSPVRRIAVGAVAGGMGVLLAALFLAGFLYLGSEDFWGVAKIAIAWHLIVVCIEGTITAFTVSFLSKVKPDALDGTPLFQWGKN
ncbi:MAG: CbiM family transporter [Desulfobacteraceae bacterium]|nr:CbiM family transporter [Desulfobacteraceae bacterium]